MRASGSWWFLGRVSLFATAVMAVVMFVCRGLFMAVLPPEMLFNVTARFLGIPAVFNVIHRLPNHLDAYAKYVLFGATFVLFLGFWFVLGCVYLRFVTRSTLFLWDGALVAVSVLLVAFVLYPLQGLGVFGLASGNFLYPPVRSHGWAALFAVVFSLVLHAAWLQQRDLKMDEGRRDSLKVMGASAVIIAGFGALGRSILSSVAYAQETLGAWFSHINGLSPEVTPTSGHYQVSKNVFNPDVREKGWQLSINGLVDTPVSLSLDDLKALPAVERTSTLVCISNQVGGDLIGSSVWTGVKLMDVLALAGVQAGASELILYADDNYSDSFPLEAAFREGTIIAYLQNGEPLTRDHGFPARVLVPGIFGMKNVKWVRELEVTDEAYLGYWQTRGWSDEATVQTMSRIDTPVTTKLEDGYAAIGGVAFAGIRGISRVEVSLDEGRSWQEAELKPALNDLSWNLWAYRWQADAASYIVQVRATDGNGQTQTAERNRPLPDGATGYHTRTINVSA